MAGWGSIDILPAIAALARDRDGREVTPGTHARSSSGFVPDLLNLPPEPSERSFPLESLSLWCFDCGNEVRATSGWELFEQMGNKARVTFIKRDDDIQHDRLKCTEAPFDPVNLVA